MESESTTNNSSSQSQTQTQTQTRRIRDVSILIPFLLGLSEHPTTDNQTQTNQSPHQTQSPSDRTDRIILINPMTQGLVVIEGTDLGSLFSGGGTGEKEGQPPASKASVAAMRKVDVVEEGMRTGECSICLEELGKKGEGQEIEEEVREMPCKHWFHGKCIEKWLGIHGSCPVCRYTMPVEEEEEEEGEEKGEGRRRRGESGEIWVTFAAFGGGGRPWRRRRDGESDETGATTESGVSAAAADA